MKYGTSNAEYIKWEMKMVGWFPFVPYESTWTLLRQ